MPACLPRQTTSIPAFKPTQGREEEEEEDS
jgi:hypothetical protein